MKHTWENQIVCELVRLETNYPLHPELENWYRKYSEGMKIQIKQKAKRQLKAFPVERGVCSTLFFVCHSDSFKNQQEKRENDMSGYFRRLVKLTGKFLCRQRINIYCPSIIPSAHSMTQRASAHISINKTSHKPSDLSPKFRSVLEATMSIKIISSSC